MALEIGTLQRPDETITGDLRNLVMWWLGSRTPSDANDEDLDRFASTLGADDEWWVCCSEATANTTAWPTGVEVVTFGEIGAAADGATHLQARHRSKHTLVPLPDRVDAIRLLRGRGFRRLGSSRSHLDSAIRQPRFPGAPTYLLCRSDEPDVLISVSVPGANHATTPRPKRRNFSGPVIAAGYVGSRTVAVTYVDNQLFVEVIGKHLASVGGLSVSLEDVGLREAELDLTGLMAPRSLAFSGGNLFVDLPSGWWQLGLKIQPTRQPDLGRGIVGHPRSAVSCAGNEREAVVRSIHRWCSD